MRILVNGDSFSRGSISWPYYLTNLTDTTGKNVVNLACAGAGNTYIHETTTRILDKEKFDLVLIMWSGIERIDFQVESIDFFEKLTYTSKYQSSQNDWSGKIINPINDQDYVEKNWIFGCGNINNDHIFGNFFKKIYIHVGHKEFVNQFTIKVVSLQNTLKQLNIPYAFSFYQDYVDQIKHSNQIDWKKCIINDNISSIAERLNSYDTDGFHLGLEANRVWASNVVNYLEKNDYSY